MSTEDKLNAGVGQGDPAAATPENKPENKPADPATQDPKAKNPKPAAKRATKTADDGIKKQPTKEELEAGAAKLAAAGKEKRVQVQAVNPDGRMWDPEHSQWIEGGKPCLATESGWLLYQIEFGKIKRVE